MKYTHLTGQVFANFYAEYLNYFYISGGYGKLVSKKRWVRKKYERFLHVQSRPPSWEEVLARRR